MLLVLIAVQMQTVTEQVNEEKEEIRLLLDYYYNHPGNVVKGQLK